MSRRSSATVSTKFTDARRVLSARGYTLREPVPGRKAGGLVDLVFTNRAQVSFAGLRPRQVVNHLEGAECLSRKDELCDILRGAFSDGALDAFVPRCFNARDPAQLRAFLCTYAFLASGGSSTEAVQAQCDAGESDTSGGETPNGANGANDANVANVANGDGTEGAVGTESASACTLRAKFENTLAAAEGLVAACQTMSITEEEWSTVLGLLAPVDMAPGGVVDGRLTGAASAVVGSVNADNATGVGSASEPGRTQSNDGGPCDADGEQKSSSSPSVSLSSTSSATSSATPSATASATLKPFECQSALARAAGASGTGGTTDVQRRLMRSNCWILKPAAQSCGQGIVCSTDLGHLLRRAAALRFQCVLQKYIENPLLLHGRKFDIRVWVVILSVDPLDVRMFTPCYLRLTSSQYSTDWDDPFAHLCNFSIQKEYTGAGSGGESLGGGTGAEEAKRPMEMWTSDKFKDHLQREYGGRDMWSEKVLPAMRHIVTCSLQAALATGRIKRRGLGFEWLGYDIMLDDALDAYLIEINTSPDMSHSTPVTATLVPRATETLVDIVLGEAVDDADDSDIPDVEATRAEAEDSIMEWVQMDLDLDAGTAGPTNIPPAAIDSVGDGEDAHPSRQHPARVVGEMLSSSTCERLGLACPTDDDCFQLSVAATSASFSFALPPTTLAHIVAVRGNVPPKELRSAAARVSPRLRPHDTTVGGGGRGGAVATVRLPILFDPRQLECIDRGQVVASAGTAADMDSKKTDDDNTPLLATWAVFQGLGTGARVAVVNVSESCCGAAVTDEGNKGEGVVGASGASGGECHHALNDTVSRALAALPTGTAVIVVARSSVTVNTSVADALGDRNALKEAELWHCELARADTSLHTTFQLNLTRHSV